MSSLRPQFAETISRIGNVDPDLFVIVGDISHGLLTEFRSKFPERYRNIGICEPAMISLAAGLNVAGFNPVIHTIAPFLIERSFEQIKLDFGYQMLDCNLVSVGSSFDYAKLGCSHHSYIDVALVASVEGSRVFLPGSKVEFDILFNAYYKEPGIKYFRLTENGHGLEHLTSYMSPGESVITSAGDDLTIVALGPSLKTAHEVTENMKAKGITCEVVYVNSIKPFDSKLVIKSVKKTKRLVTISELSPVGGLKSACDADLAGKTLYESIDFSVNEFIRGYGDFEELRERAGIGSNQIQKGIEGTFNF